MPVIAAHHANDGWRPQQPWPVTTYVQWGGKGVVFAREDTYTTAFFEAFPKDGTAGFLRGEGASVADAEIAAFTKWQRYRACLDLGGHRWSRTLRLKDGKTTTYTNGGCFCLRCGAFQTVMTPIVALGAYRKPLSGTELQSIASGFCRAEPNTREDRRSLHWRQRIALRAKIAGIDLPPITPRPDGLKPFAEDGYERECRHAIRRYLRTHPELAIEGEDGHLVDAMTRTALKSLIEDDED